MQNIHDTEHVCQRQLFPLFLYRPQRCKRAGSRWLRSFNNDGNSLIASVGLDGKHVKIYPPANSGSLYHNFKGRLNVVLMALVDANLQFIYVDAGWCGGHADGGIWRNCALNQRMEKTNIPPPRELPGTDVKSPYVNVGDGVFPLTENLQRLTALIM